MSVDLTDIAIIFGGVFIAFIIVLAVLVKAAYERGYEIGRVVGLLEGKIASQAAIIAAQRRVEGGYGEEWEEELDV